MARNKRQKRSNLPLEQLNRNDAKNPRPLLSTLPDDVLYEVFLRAIACAKGHLSIHEAPLNLSQTCRSLRTFALSKNRFWAHIDLTLTPRNRLDTPAFSMSSLWLTRSGDALLDISVDLGIVGRGRTSVVDEKLHAVSKLVASQSRWKRLLLRDRSIFLPSSEIPGWAVTDMSQLLELDIDFVTIQDPACFFLNVALKLSLVSATQGPIAPRLVHLHVLGVYDQVSLVAMLAHCPALECLNIGSGEEHTLPLVHSKAGVGPSGTNNRLSRIVISKFPARADLLSFLNQVRTSALEAMDVRLPYIWAERLTTFLLSTHIGSLLRRASLNFSSDGHRRPPVEHRNKLYEALPNLTHLYLALKNDEAKADLQSLSFEATGGGCVPELEYFEMKVAAKVDTGPLEGMLTSRMLHNERFKAMIDTNEWTVRRSTMFSERESIKLWVDSGRLEVLFDAKKKPRPLVHEYAGL